nr:hypothetical protein GCM10020092_043590 [Actinoplanes digitatis]
MTVLALEEILDRREGWARGRHSEDYHVIVFGAPSDDEWGWRFEGHHLSVSMTVVERPGLPRAGVPRRQSGAGRHRRTGRAAAARGRGGPRTRTAARHAEPRCAAVP